MAAFFASGHAVDLVLLVIALEFVFLSWRWGRKPLAESFPLDGRGAEVGVRAPVLRDRTLEEPPTLVLQSPASTPMPALAPSRGKGSKSLDRVLALLPGVFMLLALRGALTGAPWPWVAAPLAASFPFHLADLARRGF